MAIYAIMDREAGNIIDIYGTEGRAKWEIECMENEDKQNDCFVENFYSYEIIDSAKIPESIFYGILISENYTKSGAKDLIKNGSVLLEDTEEGKKTYFDYVFGCDDEEKENNWNFLDRFVYHDIKFVFDYVL